MTELAHHEIPTNIYLAEETFGWAFEERLTIAPNPPDVRRIVEVTAHAGGHDPELIASRGLMLILCGGPYTRLGRVAVDSRWDSSSDETPYYHGDQLWQPDRTQTRPELKRDITDADHTARAARFELVVDTWDRNFGTFLGGQIMARRTSGNAAQIIRQELAGAMHDLPFGKHARQMRTARTTIEQEQLRPFIFGRRA